MDELQAGVEQTLAVSPQPPVPVQPGTQVRPSNRIALLLEIPGITSGLKPASSASLSQRMPEPIRRRPVVLPSPGSVRLSGKHQVRGRRPVLI